MTNDRRKSLAAHQQRQTSFATSPGVHKPTSPFRFEQKVAQKSFEAAAAASSPGTFS